MIIGRRAISHHFVCRLLAAKGRDESKALVLCQAKVKQKKLPMKVIDAEYQWYVSCTDCLWRVLINVS